MAETQANQTAVERTKELTDRLEAGIQDLLHSEKYKEYLKSLSQFHRYSTRNTLLIHMQNPHATRVASFNKWKNDFKRHVKKGEKSIRIFAPIAKKEKREFDKIDPETKAPMLDKDGKVITEELESESLRFKLVPVFDIGQTYGEPLPEIVENLTGDVNQYEAFLDTLREVSPLPIEFEPLPDNNDGYCRYGEKIGIREGMSEVQTISALVHEITHAKLHDKQKSAETATGKSKSMKEVEAESISYVVCQHFGIETSPNSFGYLAEWGSDDMSEFKASLDTIRKESNVLINAINEHFEQICKDRGIDFSEKDEVQNVVDTATEPPVISNQPTEPAYTTDTRTENIAGVDFAFTDIVPDPNEVIYQLTFWQKGTGTDVLHYFNEGDERHGDYETLAHISPDRTVEFVKTDLSAEIKDKINAYAETADIPNMAADVGLKPENTVAESEMTDRVSQPQNTIHLTELEQKSIDFAKSKASLPLQGRLNIIAETFGCKTASIETSPCTGKWRGTSDISLVFDNGSSIFIGNHRTPQAKTLKVQNECVNGALVQYNPEIVSEAKTKALAALSIRQAEDNAVAAQKGLKPYTLLNVEFNDASDKSIDGHLGWYYVTLAVDEKIFAHIETGLNYDITHGVVSENISKPNYYTAGALKENDVDYVFNNVGHSSHTDLYQINLSGEALERAQSKLNELLSENESAEIMPDPAIDVSERDLYGYTYAEILPLTKDRALELYDGDNTVFLLYEDNTEAMAFDRSEIENHDGIFGIEREDWEKSTEYAELLARKSEQTTSYIVENIEDSKARPPEKPPTTLQPVYRESFAYAHENGEAERYVADGNLSVECKNAIDTAINESRYDTNHYKMKDAVKQVVDEYGSERVELLMAKIVQGADWDGRYSKQNKDWAKGFEVPESMKDVYSNTHPCLLDGFLNKVREKPSVLEALKTNTEKSRSQSDPKQDNKKSKEMEM